LRILPEILGVTSKSFDNYRKIAIDEPQDIPHEIVAKLEAFFSLEPGQLQNYTVDTRPIAEQEILI
jgi:hypothetical protein